MIIKLLTGAAATGVMAVTLSVANAAPIQGSQSGPAPTNSNVIQVHGFHGSCQRGPNGWHRHNKWGQRRACRPWRGNGRRPDACIKVGPIWYCDY
jgi:hypothetical protein